ncbi:adenosine deaminase [Streptomyces sp. NPDC092296]|uniref:adenosine deaminase family protein n=1 Tax=Streptomyces sp. NPDC092296 TaxID=3366012 RepID=UPI00380BA140
MTHASRAAASRRAALFPLAVSAALALSLLPAPSASARGAAGPTAAARRVSGYLQGIRDRPKALASFFHDLPKGGDLHNHLSGAASTELLLRLAVEDGLCIDPTDTAIEPPCTGDTRPASDTEHDADFRREVIRAWSMQDFKPGAESGHDHFFATFGKFGEASWRHPGRLVADVANRAAEQHQFYLETMLTPASSGAAALAAKVGWDSDLARMRRKLLADGGIDRLVRQARADADATMAEFHAAAHCGTAHAEAGCSLPVRFISQVSRSTAPERVFTQLVLGMELAERDPRFVAVDLVQPEDAPVALRDYTLQMRMLDYLHGQYPGAHITLHAGELVPGLVKPEDLTFHIRQAVVLGRAERIGHGVDIRHEDGYQDLLQLMARRHIAVEVPLTSNAQILGVNGAEHPFPLYRQYGVPVALSTDDEGVERTDISHEYQRAALTYRLDYPALKKLARDSLEYGFLTGHSLWRGRDGYQVVPECAGDRLGAAHPRTGCSRFLAANAKAAVEWKQEGAFGSFEQKVVNRKA